MSKKSHGISLSLNLLTVFHSGKGQLEQVFLGNCVSAGSLNMTGTRERERERLKPGTQSLAWVSDAQGSPPCMLDSETQTWLPTFHLSQRRSHLSKEKEVYDFLRSFCSGRVWKSLGHKLASPWHFVAAVNNVKANSIPECLPIHPYLNQHMWRWEAGMCILTLVSQPQWALDLP